MRVKKLEDLIKDKENIRDEIFNVHRESILINLSEESSDDSDNSTSDHETTEDSDTE